MIEALDKRWIYIVKILVKRDLKIRYRNSILGYAWSMLNPLLMMTVITIVFSTAFRGGKIPHYPIYILSGLICWNMFAQSTMGGVNGIVHNAPLLKKVKVPSWVFPTSIIGSASLNVLFSLAPYVAIAYAVGLPFPVNIWQLIPLFIIFFIFIEGVVLILSAMTSSYPYFHKWL